jgi:hypothetical protein
MSRMPLTSANHALQGKRFLNELDHDLFATLIGEIEQLCDGDRFQLPQFNEMDAWDRAWDLYEKLSARSVARERAEAEKKAAEPRHEDPWPPYIQNLGTLRTFVRMQSITQLEQTWAGLDLGEPVLNGKPVPDWPDRAFRIQRAITNFSELGPERRKFIPLEMRVRKLEDEVARLKRAENHLIGQPAVTENTAVH